MFRTSSAAGVIGPVGGVGHLPWNLARKTFLSAWARRHSSIWDMVNLLFLGQRLEGRGERGYGSWTLCWAQVI